MMTSSETEESHLLESVTSQRQAILRLEHFNSKKSRRLGIAQIVAGVFCFLSNYYISVFNNALLEREAENGGYMEFNVFVVGLGYWCPLFFFTSGTLAIIIDKEKYNDILKALFVTSFFACFTSFGNLLYSCLCIESLDVGGGTNSEIAAFYMDMLRIVTSFIAFVTSTMLLKLCGDILCTCSQGTNNKTAAVPQTVEYTTTNNPDATTPQSLVETQQRPTIDSTQSNVYIPEHHKPKPRQKYQLALIIPAQALYEPRNPSQSAIPSQYMLSPPPPQQQLPQNKQQQTQIQMQQQIKQLQEQVKHLQQQQHQQPNQQHVFPNLMDVTPQTQQQAVFQSISQSGVGFAGQTEINGQELSPPPEYDKVVSEVTSL